MSRVTRVGRGAGLIAVGVALATHTTVAFQGASDFVPMDQLAKQESVPGGTLLVAAYAFAWVAVTAYLWTIWRRAKKMERELGEVTARLAQTGRASH
jgi:CcmD family protein